MEGIVGITSEDLCDEFAQVVAVAAAWWWGILWKVLSRSLCARTTYWNKCGEGSL
jgi:hypothetical protein